MPATAAIIIIGNEILSGKFADANGPFLIGAASTSAAWR
jgi:molybdopterin-biosynthesis enzyme MoeA-like protein